MVTQTPSSTNAPVGQPAKKAEADANDGLFGENDRPFGRGQRKRPIDEKGHKQECLKPRTTQAECPGISRIWCEHGNVWQPLLLSIC